MSANWGKNVKISLFGESHGIAIGCNLDGIPAGVTLDIEEIRKEMKRRSPGRSEVSTPRKEDDEIEILSGIVDNVTTGTPIAMIIRNTNQQSKDYSEISTKMRPGHADYSGMMRYNGFNDIRGSGHFSGRITASLVFAGAIAKQILEKSNIYVGAHIKSIGKIKDRCFEEKDLNKDTFQNLRLQLLPTLDKNIEEDMKNLILEARDKKNSVGGVVEVSVIGVKPGIGDPFFESIESEISSMMFSIPSIKGIEFGAGFSITEMLGSESNDEMYFDDNKNIKSYTNNNGGIIGGITTGMPINFSVAIKPTASIETEQKTVNIETKENTTLEVIGRHDPSIVPRVIVVIEASTALVMLDRIIESKKY